MANEDFRNFLGLGAPSQVEALLLPIPFESTTHFQFGTADAPASILRASQGLETFDLEFDKDFSEIGILTQSPKDFSNLKVESALNLVESEMDTAFNEGLWPMMLGGESILSLGAYKSARKSYSELGYLRLDSRPRARDFFEGNAFSSGCLLRRVVEIQNPTALWGLQESSAEEASFLKASAVQRIEGAKDLKDFPEHLHLSISADVFSSAEVPGTSFGNPSGLSYATTLQELRKIFSNFNVTSVDICDLRPIKDSLQGELFMARLCAKLLAYKFWGRS